MQAVQRAKSPSTAWRAYALLFWAAALLISTWVYVLARIEPAIQLHYSGLAFFYGPAFLKPFLSEPGGLVQYAGVFLGQCDARPILGSFLQAAVAVLLGGLTWLCLKAVTPRKVDVLALVPAFLALYLRERWGYSAYAISLVMVCGVGAALSLRVSARLPAVFRVLLCWAVAAGAFFVAGPIACLIYGCLTATLEFARGRKWLPAVAILGPVLLPFIWAFVGPNPNYWRVWVPDRTAVKAGLIFLGAYIPAVVLGCLLFRRPLPEPEPPHAHRGKKDHRPVRPDAWRKWEPAAAALMFIAGWTLVWLAFDHTRSALARVDFYANRGEDARVIQEVMRMRAEEMDGPSELRFQRALCHSGWLSGTLFSFTNLNGLPLLPSLRGDLRNCRPQAEALLELGLVNDAEHLAHEALEYEGERPDLLRLLGRINVLKDRPNAARVFFGRLAAIPFERNPAREALSRLTAEPAVDVDPGLALIRPRMLTKDIAHESLVAEPLLLSLLACNSSNRMAFDYLITDYLLRQNLKKLTAELPRLEQFGAAEIPVHWEEALLIQQALTGQPLPLGRFKIRDSTRTKFELFTGILDQQPEAQRNPLAVAGQFRGTYWYYYLEQQARAKAN